MRALEGYDWPGNVRELENALTRASILARGATLGPEHLRLGSDRPQALEDGEGGIPEAPEEGGAVSSSALGGLSDLTLDWAIAKQVLRVLEHTRWNKSEAARLLKISRSRLARHIEKYGLEERR
jgi:DNA-binding NtrC family response regulator